MKEEKKGGRSHVPDQWTGAGMAREGRQEVARIYSCHVMISVDVIFRHVSIGEWVWHCGFVVGGGPLLDVSTTGFAPIPLPQLRTGVSGSGAPAEYCKRKVSWIINQIEIKNNWYDKVFKINGSYPETK